MNLNKPRLTLHPHFLELLFAHKSKASAVFKDILGLHEISHFSISHIDNQGEMLTLSSTPSLEYNLFNSDLWRFDQTYHHTWYELCTSSPWQALYTPERYDELYYLKQAQTNYPIGLSMAVNKMDGYIIYSIAANSECPMTQDRFDNHHDDFYRIGTYCSNELLPLLLADRLTRAQETRIITSH